MNEQEYKRFYDRVGKDNGWDFSKVKCTSEGDLWDFYEEVSRKCKKTDLLMDIGTGGGEAVISLAEAVLLVVGIDRSEVMIETAQANMRKSGKSNVRMLHMDAEKLDFPEHFFNLVTSRHAPFDSKEVAKVLVDGGLFLTQQVSEDDKINLKQAFGRGQSFDIPTGTLQNTYISELHAAGFKDIQVFEYNATEYYHSYEDLVFLLKHTPIIPNFGENDNDFALLAKFINQYQTTQGIMTNAKRFMIVATV